MLHVCLDFPILTRNDCTQLQQWCKKKRRRPIEQRFKKKKLLP